MRMSSYYVRALLLLLCVCVLPSRVLSLTTTLTPPNVHMFSLQYPSETAFSKPVKDVWRWKDAVLGDGRDFFIPKPKTLTALIQRLMKQSGYGSIQECMVVSNCARFEIILYGDGESARQCISETLAQQVQAHQGRSVLQNELFSRLDSARNIITPSTKSSLIDASIVNEISNRLDQTSGIQAVVEHLSLVAAGMGIRPTRPDLEPMFRPFSSRDAHILRQLKRTVIVGESSNTLLLVKNAALTAGKAARNPSIVPAILPLQEFAGEGKFDMTAPPDFVADAKQAVVELAIQPAVMDCIERYQAQQSSDKIALLHAKARHELEHVVTDISWLKRQLHQPTMQLRQGQDVDVDQLIRQLEEQWMANQTENCK